MPEKDGQPLDDTAISLLNADLTLDLPIIGKVKMSDIEKNLPYYLMFRKDLKTFLPGNVDKMLMTLAKEKGLVEDKPKPRGIMGYDIPLTQMHENILLLHNEGWSGGQIAGMLNIYPTDVNDFVSQLPPTVEEEEEEEVSEDGNFFKIRKPRILLWLLKRIR